MVRYSKFLRNTKISEQVKTIMDIFAKKHRKVASLRKEMDSRELTLTELKFTFVYRASTD